MDVGSQIVSISAEANVGHRPADPTRQTTSGSSGYMRIGNLFTNDDRNTSALSNVDANLIIHCTKRSSFGLYRDKGNEGLTTSDALFPLHKMVIAASFNNANPIQTKRIQNSSAADQAST
jgi:microcystin-dependent protein